DAPGLAAAEFEDVDLVLLVALALRREGDAAAVGRPRHVALRRLRERDLPRLRAPLGGHEPEIARRFLLVVGRLVDAEDDPLAVGARRRAADARHQPESLVRERALRRDLDDPRLRGLFLGQGGKWVVFSINKPAYDEKE